MTMLTLPPPAPDLALPAGVLSLAQARELARIENGKFFLVRTKGNAGIGERLICDPMKGGCGCVHDHLTVRCVPRPYQGISAGLYGYWKVAGNYGARAYLSPEERARVAELDARFGRFGDVEDLAKSHPQLARSMGVDERDVLRGAVALGVLEPISQRRAYALRDQINARARQTVIRFKP